MFTSSFSKTVAPGLRVGYIVAPKDVAGTLAAAASRTYISPSLLAEAAIAQLVTGGHLEGNIAHVTNLMRERRDAMAAGLVHMPEGTVCTPPQGGFFMWLELPEGLSADALFAPAADAGIAYVKGSDCFLDGGERTLRLAYSGVSPAEIAEGMERLGAVFRPHGPDTALCAVPGDRVRRMQRGRRCGVVCPPGLMRDPPYGRVDGIEFVPVEGVVGALDVFQMHLGAAAVPCQATQLLAFGLRDKGVVIGLDQCERYPQQADPAAGFRRQRLGPRECHQVR